MTVAAATKARRKRDPESVRRIALEAATRLFAARGYAGTSYGALSRASGLSAGLIQYHFGSKRDLYEAVKAHAMEAFVDAQLPVVEQQDVPFQTIVADGMRQYFALDEAQPLWGRLSAWAHLEGDDGAWPGETQFMDRLVEMVRDSQAQGSLPGDLDPEVLLVVVGGMMQGWLYYKDRNKDRLAHLGDPTAQAEAYIALCMRLLRQLNGEAST